jgi:hypothetical protein
MPLNIFGHLFPFIGHFLDFVSPKNTLTTVVCFIKSETGFGFETATSVTFSGSVDCIAFYISCY